MSNFELAKKLRDGAVVKNGTVQISSQMWEIILNALERGCCVELNDTQEVQNEIN